MSNNSKDDVKLSLKVLVNKEENKVLYAVADSHLADILLSFLTLPLGRIVRILDKHYGDEAPSIGSLSSLYRSIANLDASLFVTEGAKRTLLNPTSTFEDEYKRLKLDITDSPPAEYFSCFDFTDFSKVSTCIELRSVSTYYDEAKCRHHSYSVRVYSKKVDERVSDKTASAGSSGGVFTKHEASFIVSDDLHILPNNSGVLGISSFLGIMDTDKPETLKLSLGPSEIMSLLKASLTSPTPLSDIILNKTTDMKPSSFIFENDHQEIPNSKTMCIKALLHRYTGEVLYAKAKVDFIDFLCSFLFIPLGVAEHRVDGKAGIKAIDLFYQSTGLIDDDLFNSSDTKNRLMKPNLVHGCVSPNHILPLSEESLPDGYTNLRLSSSKFPEGQGRYLKEEQIYQVKDDLTVEPFCIISIISSLKRRNVPFSNMKEVELEIGSKEALSILKASLTSSSALTHALQTHKYKE